MAGKRLYYNLALLSYERGKSEGLTNPEEILNDFLHVKNLEDLTFLIFQFNYETVLTTKIKITMYFI